MFSFENNNKSLVYKFENNDKLDHTSIGMISNNKIKNICSAEYSKVNNDEVVKVDLTSKVPSLPMFSRKLNKNIVVRLLESICGAIASAKDYMIDVNQIVLDLNYTFMDTSNGEFDFVCLPLQNMKNNDFLGFIKKVIFGSDFDGKEDTRYVTAIIRYVNGVESFSPESLQELVDAINKNDYSIIDKYKIKINKQNVQQPIAQAPKQNVQQPIAQAPKQNIQQPNAQASKQNVQQPNAQAPKQNVQQPIAQAPKQNVQQPNAQAPKQNVQQPNAQAPKQNVQQPNAQAPKQNVQQPNAQAPKQNVQQPSVQAPKQNIQQPNVPMQGQQIRPMQQPPMGMQNGPTKEKKESWLQRRRNKKNAEKQLVQGNRPQGNVPQGNVPQGNMPQGNMPQGNMPNNNGMNNMGKAQPYPFNNGMPIQNEPKKKKKSKKKDKKNLDKNQTMQKPIQPMQNNVPTMQKPVQPVQNNVPPMQKPVQPMQNNVPPMQKPTQPEQNNNPQNVVDYGETTVLGADTYGETTVLVEENYQNTIIPCLIRMKNNEKININKPMFKIGKERDFVDYFVDDNKYVSRIHANIVCKNGHCYIVDNNSRNHTFVNGQKIEGNKEVELKNGDTVKLANEAFEFKVF